MSAVQVQRFPWRTAVRLSAVVVVALLAMWSAAGRSNATSFQPRLNTTIADPTPGAHSDITIDFNIEAPDSNFGALVNFTPAQFGVAADAEVTNGALAGTVSSSTTLGLLNGGCFSRVVVSFQMMDASTDTSNPVYIYEGIYDNDGNGLVDNLDRYPSFLNLLAPGITPRARLYGQAVVSGVTVPLNFVLFEPGAELPLLPALDPSLGYPTVVFLGDPTQPPTATAISDFCTPLQTTTVIPGVSSDNPNTAADEGGQVLRTNPAARGRYNSVIFARSRWDADNDGIENELDPCPLVRDTSWDPRAIAPAGDQDRDGLPSTCDPDDSTPSDLADVFFCPFGFTGYDEDADCFSNRQDNCPLVANFYPLDSDRDGLGDDCDPFPEDGSDGGASHRHQLCVSSTLTVGSPPPGGPPSFRCPSGPDLPVPPRLELFPEDGLEGVGKVHSLYVSAHRVGGSESAPAVRVNFTVAGANPTSGTCLTDNFGSCGFNYQGLNEGIDTVVASATIDGRTITDTVTNEWVGPPANDDFASAIFATGLPFRHEQLLASATGEAGEQRPCANISETFWYAFTPAEDVFVTAMVETEFLPMALAAYSGTSLASLELLHCAGPFFPPFPKFVPSPPLPAPPLPEPPPLPAGVSAQPAGNGFPRDGFFNETRLSLALEAGKTYYFQVGKSGEFFGYPGQVAFSIVAGLPGDTDCSGALDSLDALEVLRVVAGLPSNGRCIDSGDVDCDQDADAVDALLILRVLAALAPTRLQACPAG